VFSGAREQGKDGRFRGEFVVVGRGAGVLQ